MKNIRPANTNDSLAIKELITETLLTCVAVDNESFEVIYSDICAILNSWEEKPEDAVHVVYEYNNSIVGIVLIINFEMMHLCFVHPSHQRKGIGRALIDHALNACRLSGSSTQITLNSSSYAAPFYRKYGFIPNGKPRDLPGGCIPLTIGL